MCLHTGNSSEAQAFLTKGAQVIVRMRGLPYDCTAKDVVSLKNPCEFNSVKLIIIFLFFFFVCIRLLSLKMVNRLVQ